MSWAVRGGSVSSSAPLKSGAWYWASVHDGLAPTSAAALTSAWSQRGTAQCGSVAAAGLVQTAQQALEDPLFPESS
ncbi:MAG TPA: hypothetical protein EYQ18_27215 [Candidatus Handelsmanbacteria bacterium]|nr:hypothetical protein [Candidatus Handelsmanbacteria bacterium]